MTFTDDDFTSIKNMVEGGGWFDGYSCTRIRALIDRLEAAEACAGYLGSIAMDATSKHLLDQWDKTKLSK